MRTLPNLGLAAALALLAACGDRGPAPLEPGPLGSRGGAPPGAGLGGATPAAAPGSARLQSVGPHADGPQTITFEGVGNNVALGSQYAASAGVTFTAGQGLVQGGSLNFSNYPPRSGTTVAYNLTASDVSFTFGTTARRVGGYVTSLYGIRLTCWRADGSAAGGAAAPYPNLANWSASVAAPNYYLEVAAPGIKRCTFTGSPNYFTIDDLTFTPSAEIEIVSVTTQLPGSSFTSRAGENTVQLRARVGDPAMEPRVEWKVEDDPGDNVTSGPVTAAPGLLSSFTVPIPPQRQLRWPANHPGSMTRKALAYRIRAFYVVDGDTTWSEPKTIRQTEKDVLRQEYIDYAKQRVPAREDLGVFATASFSAAELNWGDYSLFLATPTMRTGIQAFRLEVKSVVVAAGQSFSGLTLTSAFRNPVHHHKHAGASSTESQHLYGNAVDVRIGTFQGFSQKEIFYEMVAIAKKPSVNACYEPEAVVRAANSSGTLTHFHLDFRASCPAGW